MVGVFYVYLQKICRMISSVSTEKTLITSKLKAYWILLKPRLSFLVAFSASFGYIFAKQASLDWLPFIIFTLGGFLISGASVTINQILEKDLDKIMQRTCMRPLPSGALQVGEAIGLALITLLVGVFFLAFSANLLTVLLALFSVILYGFVYTPLKRKGSFAVFVGAIPGALPPLLGWAAATNQISFEALIIFAIQFIWQFPHFWAIAWLLDEDYQKAGFRLLPSAEGRSLNSALQIAIYTLFLIPMGLLPPLFGLTGIRSAIVVTVAGCLFAAQSFSLIKDQTPRSALRIMFASFVYLPVVQITYLIDKV